MRRMIKPCSLWRGLGVIVLSLALVACAQGRKPHPKTPPNTFTYIEDISLAKLALDKSTSSMPQSLIIKLNEIEAYTNQKPQKPVHQPVLVVSYRFKEEDNTYRLLIPYVMPVEKAPFNALRKITEAMGTIYTLYDIKPGVLTLLPGSDPVSFDNKSGKEIADLLTHYTQDLAADVRPLPAMAEARVQLRLSRFFMAKGRRDAAYLSLDNAKQALAQASGQTDDVQELSRRLEQLEGQLRKSMPFKL